MMSVDGKSYNTKTNLSEGRIDGNLKDIEQVYKINYLFPTSEYCDKIELAILLELKDKQEGAYRSLRFSNTIQLRSFIMNLVRSYILFSKQRKEITVDNFRFKIHHLITDLEKQIKNS